MKLSPLFFFIFFISTGLGFEEPKIVTPETIVKEADAYKGDIKLAAWNVRWFPGLHPTKATDEDRVKHTKDVREFLGKENPTIGFYCEVLDAESLSKLELDYPYIACTQIPRPEDEGAHLPNQGLAFMSKVAWKEVWALDFSAMAQTEDRPSRGILGGIFELPSGKKLIFYGVHLKSNRGGPDKAMVRRKRGLKYLLWDMERKGFDPTKDWIVVAGDFNTSPTDPTFEKETTIQLLTDKGFVMTSKGMTREQAITIPKSRYPANDFDHMLVSPAMRKGFLKPSPWMLISAVERNLSDHYALFLPLTKLTRQEEN